MSVKDGTINFSQISAAAIYQLEKQKKEIEKLKEKIARLQKGTDKS